ncbi:unnamed protein product, partial [Polarella glacialis]
DILDQALVSPMYNAWILLLFILTGFLRHKLHRRDTQEWLHKVKFGRLPWAAIVQPYSFFLVVLLVVYLSMLSNFASLMHTYANLDPTAIHLPALNATRVDEEQGAYAVPGWLRFLAIVAPAFVGLTFVVTAAHLWLHLPRSRGFDEHLRWFPTYSHDLAMQVVALPLVYGIFALGSLVQMLELFTGKAYSDATNGSPGTVGPQAEAAWSRAVGHVDRSYKTNFELADLYEAWALRSFGKLCFTLVSRQVRLEVPTVQYILETVKSHLSVVASAESRDLGVLNDLVILSNPQKLLYEPLQQTSYIGVRVFVWTYGFKSVYLLALAILNDPPFSIPLCGDDGVFPAVCSLIPYVDGAAFLASTLAIYNLVVFEQNLQDILNRNDFRAFEKFLSVKVLVSITFLQGFALQVILGSVYRFSKAQIDLCYAALICCEVLPLSLLVFKGWRPSSGDWYAGDSESRQSRRDVESELMRGQLADEASSPSDDAAFVASRQPTEALTARLAQANDITAVIELRGDVRAKEGKALEDLINTFSKTVRAHYKPAALFRCRTTNDFRVR